MDRVEALLAIGRVQALVEARDEFDALIAQAVREACSIGVNRSVIADVLGVHRATLYRQYLSADDAYR